MTFSICAHETYETPDGDSHHRFGVAVTTRLPGVGTLCPFVSDRGAVATQSLVNVELGERGLAYVEDGLAIEDALEALLNADDGAPHRQLHGVDREGSFAFTGAECVEQSGHLERDEFTVAGNMLTGEDVLEALLNADDGAPHRQLHGVDREGSFAFTGAECVEQSGHLERDEFTVAGNMLTGEDVLEAAAANYAANAVHETTDPATGPNAVRADAETDPFAKRLIDALAAGDIEGGDKREGLSVQSAAVAVETTERHEWEPSYNDLRIDASETPIADLRETYDLAMAGYEATLERYSDAVEADSLESVEDEEP
ncbi:DUF1028 domain-containing protein [Haloterrigena salinisoli]|uniref:DUF1028 domain-containing protein n=1 Tax=Haloterrigena salinisoli TaxID=3132747 RepID=UPI0030D2F5D3